MGWVVDRDGTPAPLFPAKLYTPILLHGSLWQWRAKDGKSLRSLVHLESHHTTSSEGLCVVGYRLKVWPLSTRPLRITERAVCSVLSL